ncbi:MAG: DUF4199 domain-containing protein [Spirosomataceae bacterium]
MENQPSTARVALKWGIIIGVASIVYSTILFLAGQFGNQSLGYISYLILIAGLVLAMKDFRSQNEGFMRYGQGLGLGALTSAVSGVLGGIYTYIYMSFIDTTLTSQMLDKAREEWEKRGMSEEQMEQAAQMTQMFTSPGMIFVFAVFFSILFGLILSLIIAAIMKKDKPVNELL